jgi:hypothetical protein
LIRPCALRARSVSFSTGSVRPASPIITTGDSAWACARRALRCAELRMGAGGAGCAENRQPGQDGYRDVVASQDCRSWPKTSSARHGCTRI